MLAGAVACAAEATASQAAPVPRIAAVVTEYRPNSHADVIVGKYLEGCRTLDVDYRPGVKIASLYMDQKPARDIGTAAAARHGVNVFPTIREALTLGGRSLAVDGVLLIGEHGSYPYNELGQHLYPRRRFFEEAAAVVRESGRPVPFFNDKHLSYAWEHARWMVDTARELRIPLMAGSSVPLAWRRPDLKVGLGTPFTAGLAVGYGGVESYGFHTLEMLQAMLERRAGGERGVRSVQCLSGDAVWRAGEEGAWSWSLLSAALAADEKLAPGLTREQVQGRSRDPDAFLIEYLDGTRGAALMLYGLTEAFLFAGEVKGRDKPLALQFWLQPGPPFGHFALLCRAIERMFLTGKPTYPVERTLLTTGILDRLMQSRHQRGRKLDTPELAVIYRAVE